jgi:hypothetical protein
MLVPAAAAIRQIQDELARLPILDPCFPTRLSVKTVRLPCLATQIGIEIRTHLMM